MLFIADLFRVGGIWAYMLLLLLLVTLPALVLLSVKKAKGRRIPGALWWIGPSAILTVGTVGTAVAFWEVTTAMGMVTPENRQRMLSPGFSTAFLILGFGALADTICGLVAAVGCAGSSMIGIGKGRRWELKGPGIAAGITVVVAVVLVALGVSVALPAVFAICGLTIAAAGACATGDQSRDDQLARDRWTVVTMAASTVVTATVLMMIYVLMETLVSLERTTPETRSAALSGGIEVVWDLAFVGVMALVGLVVVAVVVMVKGAGRGIGRAGLIGGVKSGVVLVPAVVGFVVMVNGAGPFFEAFEQRMFGSSEQEEEDEFPPRFMRIEVDTDR